jgi:hypothetical protein
MRLTILSMIGEKQEQYKDNELATYALTSVENEIGLNYPQSNVTSPYIGAYNINDTTYGTDISVTLTDSNRNITANALPNHETGTFPNSGNPNAISE